MTILVRCPSPYCTFSWVLRNPEEGWITWGHKCYHWSPSAPAQTSWVRGYVYLTEGGRVGLNSGPTYLDLLAPNEPMRLIVHPGTAIVRLK